MRALIIDTSTKSLNIAVADENRFTETSMIAENGHQEILISEIEKILSYAGISFKDLSLLICAAGPGSFTGLRIGMATLKGLSLSLNIPLVSIPTLDAYVFPVKSFNTVVGAIDAGRGMFYVKAEKMGQVVIECKEAKPEEIIALNEKVIITGPDASLLSERIRETDSSFSHLVYANQSILKSLYALGKTRVEKYGADKDEEGPLYIRKAQAEESLIKGR